MYSRNPCMGLSGAFSVIQEEDRVEWKDGKCRCCWANPKNERYIRYHDEEWGRSVHDDRKLFEMLVLECFQAGLSWECILNKREAFKQAFDEFELETVCGYGEEKLQELKESKEVLDVVVKGVVNGGVVAYVELQLYMPICRRLELYGDMKKTVFCHCIRERICRKSNSFITVSYIFLSCLHFLYVFLLLLKIIDLIEKNSYNLLIKNR